jgi:hypothetical protein
LLMSYCYGFTWSHIVNNHPKNFWDAPLALGLHSTLKTA